MDPPTSKVVQTRWACPNPLPHPSRGQGNSDHRLTASDLLCVIATEVHLFHTDGQKLPDCTRFPSRYDDRDAMGPYSRALTILVLGFTSAAILPVTASAQTQQPAAAPTAASILAEVREAFGGDAWNRISELRTEGVLTAGSQTGTIQTADDLRTGANADRVDLAGGVRAENHLDGPAGDWEQDESGDVRLLPGGKNPYDIDDTYLHRHGWDEPNFGGATITLLPPQTAENVTYDLLQCRVPGGNGFTLWIDRPNHRLDRVVGAGGPEMTTIYNDFHTTAAGLTLPFRKQKGKGQSAVIAVTTRVTALTELDPADFAPPFRTDYTMPASGQVTVPAQSGVTFPMKINGQGPFPTVFDTGAVNGMSVNFAKRLGLKIGSASLPFGALGGPITVRTTHVDRVEIGGLVLRDQNFYVLDISSTAGEPEMIVGWELMRRFAVRFDFEHNQLTLFDGPGFHYSGSGTAVPLLFHPHGNGVDIPATADGHAGSFVLDTGNEVGLTLNAGLVEQANFVSTLNAHFRGYNGRGFGGPSPEAWFARLHTFRIGDADITAPVARLQTKQGDPNENAGNIGSGLLSRFILTVDTMRGTLYLEKNPDWNGREVFNRAGLIIDFAEGVDNVMTVLPGSPAAAAGLQTGDRITEIEGQPPVEDPNDPRFLKPVGTVLHLTVQHPGGKAARKTRAVTVTLRDVL